MVEIAEDTIEKEMKLAGYGSIMHDGWSKFATHYVGIFAQYNKSVSTKIGKVKSMTVIPTNVLLAMRPMCQATGEGEKEEGSDSDEEEEDATGEEEATSFTADVHAQFFRKVMKSYDVNLEDWAVCQVSLLFVTYIFYKSHYFSITSFRLQIVAAQI